MIFWGVKKKEEQLKKWEGVRRVKLVSGLLSRVLRNNIGNSFSQKYRITLVLIDIPIFLSHGQDFQFLSWTCLLN